MENKTLRFHEVDPRWELFGCPDYDSYLSRFLIEGRFHNKVPKAVVEAYSTIEYLMAHAYYFYPIYDEALSKLLRTMEMATKLRCKELGIDIIDRSKSNNKRTQQHKFAFLIDQIEKAEPEKRVGSSLHWFRRIRNFSMHPDTNSYGGGTSTPACISCVNTLNILFAPTGFFKGYIDEFEMVNQKLVALNTMPIVLLHNSERILVHKLDLIDVFLDGNNKYYCIYASTVLPSFDPETTEVSRFGLSFTFYLKDLDFVNNKFSGKQVGDEEVVVFEGSNHPSNLSRYQDYKKYLGKATMSSFNAHEMFEKSQQDLAKAYFRYVYYSGFRFELP